MRYHSYEEMRDYFIQLSDTYPDLCKYTSLGTTVQGREIPCLIIGRGNYNIFMEGAPHGDEWIAHEVVFLWADYLINNIEDPIVSDILKYTTQFVMPMMSPDSHEMHRRTNANGVDCNRNFGFHFCECGSSPNPGSPIYKGPYPFSEPETLAVKNLFDKFEFKRAISFHAGTEVLAYPWSYTSKPAPDKLHYDIVCKAVNELIRERGYPEYPFGQVSVGCPDIVTYPDAQTLERDLEVLRGYLQHKYMPVLRDGLTLVIYCASGVSIDYYYSRPYRTLSWVLEISDSKTPPEEEIEYYFNRQLPLPIVVSLDAIVKGVDDYKEFVVQVEEFL